jgi:hypothetical protein
MFFLASVAMWDSICNWPINIKKEKCMKTRFLTIAVALASVFTAHQAVAKSAKSTTVSNKKHHKKHMKNKAASIAAPTTAAPVNS